MNDTSTIVNNVFLTQKDKGEKILFSELLADPPSDEILLELFPYSRGGKPYISQCGLKIVKLRLDRLSVQEIAEKLNLTLSQVNGRFQVIKVKLMGNLLPDYIEIDTPWVRRLQRLDIPITGGYTKISELLRDMPSDQELSKISVSRGYIVGIGCQRMLSNDDLCLLQRKAAGQHVIDIARELGGQPSNIRRRLVWIRNVLRNRLKIQIDMPELFPHERDRIKVK